MGKQNRVTNSERKTNTADTTLLSLLREAQSINLLKGALIPPVLFQRALQSIAIISKELGQKFSAEKVWWWCRDSLWLHCCIYKERRLCGSRIQTRLFVPGERCHGIFFSC